MTYLRLARDLVLGRGALNEQPTVRLARMAVLCGAAAAVEKLISSQLVGLPVGWAWATPALLGLLAAADKWLLREAATPSAPVVTTATSTTSTTSTSSTVPPAEVPK